MNTRSVCVYTMLVPTQILPNCPEQRPSNWDYLGWNVKGEIERQYYNAVDLHFI
jgi:hypothetical protein